MKHLFLTIAFLISSTSLMANELNLMFIRSPGINWESPRTLAKTTVSGMSESYGLGHVNIRIACDGREVVTGIYNRYINATRNAVLKKGMGLGVLFNLFEGQLQIPKNIIPNFRKLSKAGRTNFITFKVSPATCQRLLDYYDQYVDIQNTRHRITRLRNQPATHAQQIYYGFPAISRYGEGGGCSGFAISFLEVAGIKEQWMVDEWTQFRRVPVETVGAPLRPYSVSLRSMLMSSPKRWSEEHEPHYPLYFWDPDLMVKGTTSMMNSGHFPVISMFDSQGIVLDRTNVPTPTEPIFLNDPFNAPSNPTETYQNVQELLRRYEVTRQVSFISSQATASYP